MIDLHPLNLSGRGPGLSVWAGKNWVHGDDALQLTRLFPQEVVTDVWEGLSIDPIPHTRHRADLAIAELQSLELSGDHKVVLVPSAWNAEPLGVLLSVLQAAGCRTQFFLPRCLGLAASVGAGSFWILEQSWSSLTLSCIDHGRCMEVKQKRHLGLLDWLRGLSAGVAEICLDRGRMDPLHSAESDQRLLLDLYQAITSRSPEFSPPVGEPLPLSHLNASALNETRQWVSSVVGGERVCAESMLATYLELDECSIPQDLESRVPNPVDAGPVLLEEVPEVSGSVAEDCARHILIGHEALAASAVGLSKGQPGDEVELPDGRRGVWIRLREE